MSQTDRKYKRLEALLSKTEPVQPDPGIDSANEEVEKLKVRLAELEGRLADKSDQKQLTGYPIAEGEEHLQVPGAAGRPLPTRTSEEILVESETASALDQTRQAKRVFTTATILLVFNLLSGVYPLFTLIRTGGFGSFAQPVYINFSAWLLSNVLCVLSLLLSRRAKPRPAAWLAIAGMMAGLSALVLSVAGIGLTVGLFILTLTVALALAMQLSRTDFIWLLVIAFALLVFTTLFDAYENSRPIAPDAMQQFLPVLIGILLIVLGLFVFRNFTNYSLRTKIVVAFVAATVGAVAVVALLTNRTLSTSLSAQIGSGLSEIANAKGIEVGQAVDREADILKTLALNQSVQNAAQSASRSNTLSQSEIDQRDAQWRNADAADSNTDPLVAGVLNNSLADELRAFQQEFPQHVEVFLTDVQGVSIATTNRTSDYYQADEEWWQVAYQEGLYIGQPEYDESSKTIAINMATAVLAKDSDSIVGILRTTVDFNTLTDSLIAGLFGETGRTNIYLPSGQELALEAGEGGSHNLIIRDAGFTVNALPQSGGLYQEINYNGTPTLSSQAPVSVLGDVEEDELAVLSLNWQVIALQDRAEALYPVEIQTRNILILALATAIVAGLAAYWLARTLSGPIIRLTKTAEQVAAGDLTVQAKVESNDETGILAGSFNNMVSQLRDMVGMLERRVTERTHDIQLASEVGRAVGERTTDISKLLKDAVELIRERFNLYHTQIYLTDAGNQTLVLRAGTGEVGEELLNRGHHLPVNFASINGRAASEGRAVIVANTREDPNFLPNPLLPNTQSEMSVPLIVSGKVIGVLDMQSEVPGSLNETNLPAFETLAGQLAIAIQNATLYSEAEQARSDVEAQMHHITEQGWQDFMNSIDRGERISYRADQTQPLPPEEVDGTLSPPAVKVPITISGANIGSIQSNAPERSWSDQELQILKATAAQLGQHLENLRLIAQAEGFRDQAEQVVRQLTREGWSQVAGQKEGGLGFLYDLNEVTQLSGPTNGTSNKELKHELVVRDEPIGELAAEVGSKSEEAAEIISAVAAQLSTHIETLRLAEELQKRATELQELDRLKTAFLANMSHELRTPLNSILGFADVLIEELDGPLTDTMRNDLQLIQKNGNHLLHLINDVLDMAKIEAGKMNLAPEQFRVQEILEDVLNITSPQAAGKKIKLAIEKDSDAQIEIFADRTRIRQVLLNVVTNAIKFTDKGSVMLRTHLDGENAVIVVRDTGEGIPEDKLESIFQEFTQVDTSSTRKAGGTGLGLPISRRLIEMHGGRMWAESPGTGEGVGSTFFVVLPIQAKITEAIEAHER